MPTLGSFALALQEPPVAAPGAESADVWTLIANASLPVKAVLFILVVFSVVSWAIILYKHWQFRRAERQSMVFLDVFRKSSKFSEVQAVCRTLGESPLVSLFQAGYAELTAQLRTPQGERPANPAGRPTLKSFDALDRALLRAAGIEVNKLEHRVTFLATTANITPFIGLFGTVYGIMNAFMDIGQMGSTNLAVVAQPIAEALIATAMGLFAAIPAVYFYNLLTQRVKHFASSMEDFSLEFLNIAERNFT